MPGRADRSAPRLVLGAQIEYRCWGGMAVVFDHDDGGTRLVSALGAAVLEQLADNGALERTQLLARLQQWPAAPEAHAAGLQPALEETLRDFHARRWVREAPPDP